MCIPKKSDRANQAQQTESTAEPDVISKCGRSPTTKPKLIRLEVLGARPKSGAPGTFWEVQSDLLVISVIAITEPNSPDVWAMVEWNGGTAILNQAIASRAVAGGYEVGARLPDEDWQAVSIEIYDLTALSCDLPIQLTDRPRHWKAYASPLTTTTLRATTAFDDRSVWDLLQWSEGTPGRAPNEVRIDLSTVRDAVVAVSIGQNLPKTLFAEIHICQWPVLEVQEVHFTTIPVVRDGATDIDKEFSTSWIKGLAQQSPICCVAGRRLTLEASFNVTTPPTDDEDVRVKATAKLGTAQLTWEGFVRVKAGATTVSLASVDSDNALPDMVAIHEPMKIDWSMIAANNTIWTPIGSTQQTLYVTRKDPAGVEAYWTLLDISCRAAAGKSMENDIVAAAFAPFRASVGDGKGMQRKGDGVRMSYYRDGVKTSASQREPSVYSARGILSRPDGTGRCGGWANLLIHMFKIHGILSANELWFVRGDPNNPNMRDRFLVKNCLFLGAGTSPLAPLFPYKGGVECVKQEGVPGQGKTNPQFDFGDHVVVEHDGKIYDPSYGVGPIVGQRAYEDIAIAGVGSLNAGILFDQNGTPQFMSDACGKGHLLHAVMASEDLTKIAKSYGAPSADGLFNHPYNARLKAIRLTTGGVQAGDIVVIPREMTTRPILGSKYL